MRKPRNGAYTHVECHTADGQVVRVECPYDKKEEIQKFLSENVYYVSLPVSRKVETSHGCYVEYSRYEIKQHDYKASMTSYIEVLEIKDAPSGRANVVINAHSGNTSFFCEWEDLESARKAWKESWNISDAEDMAPKLPGFKRFVPCTLLTPWFYAVGNEELVGDYVMPHGIEDDPVFRLGRPFLFFRQEEGEEPSQSVKICLGARHFLKESQRYYHGEKEEHLTTLAVFDDGSTWESGSNKRKPVPLEDDSQWQTEAWQQFRKFLAGDSKDVDIRFFDGQRFSGHWGFDKSQVISQPGNFLVSAMIKGKKEATVGWIEDFKPSEEHPTIIAWAEYKLGQTGKILERLEIKNFKPKGSEESKKWSGIYYKNIL